MDRKYDIYCQFDIRKHKETYKNYLEVVIYPNGKVVYAVPSHNECLIKIAINKLHKTRKELMDMCPKEYYFDFITWLTKITHCMSVWNNFYVCYKPTKKQLKKLELLKKYKLYTGDIRYE